MADDAKTGERRDEEARQGREAGDEPVELSERGGVKKRKTSPSEYNDRTRDRSLDEKEAE